MTLTCLSWVLAGFSKLIALIFLLLSLVALPAQAKLLVKPEEALKSAFGPSATVHKKNILLNADEVKKAQKLAHEPIKDHVFTFYVIKDKDKLRGYAGLLTKEVRTKDETSLFILSPQGQLKSIEVIAFYEPPEYIPKDSWFKSFKGKDLRSKFTLGGDIPTLSGATMSAEALTDSAKIILAVWKVKFDQAAQPSPTKSKTP